LRAAHRGDHQRQRDEWAGADHVRHVQCRGGEESEAANELRSVAGGGAWCALRCLHGALRRDCSHEAGLYSPTGHGEAHIMRRELRCKGNA
jgi:hypothetical protein